MRNTSFIFFCTCILSVSVDDFSVLVYVCVYFILQGPPYINENISIWGWSWSYPKSIYFIKVISYATIVWRLQQRVGEDDGSWEVYLVQGTILYIENIFAFVLMSHQPTFTFWYKSSSRRLLMQVDLKLKWRS